MNSQTNSFVASTCIGTTTSPQNRLYTPAVADYDGDNDKDIIVCDESGVFRLFTNDGTNNFTSATIFSGLAAYTTITPKDVDNDNDIDVVSVTGKIFINNGSAVFNQLPGVFFSGGGTIGNFKVADFNGDNKQDIIWLNGSMNSVNKNQLWINTGTIGNANFTFSSEFDNLGIYANGGAAIGDIDNDGDLDLTISGQGGWNGKVYKNNGTGIFSLSQNLTTYTGDGFLVDWDKDNDLDFLAFDYYNNFGLRLWKNDGTGTFGTVNSNSLITMPIGGFIDEVVDLNGDTWLDLVMRHGGGTRFYLNSGCQLSFASQILSNSWNDVAVSDFNNDNKPDLFNAARDTQSCIYLNDLNSQPYVAITAPIVSSPQNYFVGQNTPLVATGNNLLWYTASTGGIGSTTAPTPNTTVVGTTSYWVSNTNTNGCESARVEVVVNVNTIQTLSYNDDVYTSGYPSVTLNNFSSCQVSASLTAASQGYDGVWADRNFTLIVNGTAIGSYTGTQTIDITSYLPITSVQMNGNFYNWSWVDLTVNISSFESSMPVTGPTAANVNYCIGATASQLSATLNSSGTTLKWYTDQYGDNYSATAPTPSTASAGTTTYYVSQANASGCESVRSQINVIVTAYPSNPSATTTVNYTVGDVATVLTATGSNLLWYTTSTGGTGSTTAPTPSTASVGTTSYWVSQSNNGCESTRTEIVVQVTALPATHLNFDGVNDYVALPATAINNLPQGTIEAWIYPTATVLDNQTICSKQSNFENSYAIFTLGGGNAANGKLYYQSKNGAYIVSNATLTANQWTHVAVTFTGLQAKIFINGTLDGTASGDFSLPNDNTVTATALGAWLGDGGGQYFNGNIDEFRVWNYALSPTDIQNTMNCELQASQTNIVTNYKFNQGFNNSDNTAITTLIDNTGGYNGTLTNFAKTGTVSNFASGSPVIIGNSCALLSSNYFTINNNIKLYPNPTSSILNLEIVDLSNVNVELMDLNGRILMKQALSNTSNAIDFSGYNAAIYILKVTSSEGMFTYKIVKQ